MTVVRIFLFFKKVEEVEEVEEVERERRTTNGLRRKRLVQSRLPNIVYLFLPFCLVTFFVHRSFSEGGLSFVLSIAYT